MRSMMTWPGGVAALALAALLTVGSLACDARPKVSAQSDEGVTNEAKPKPQDSPEVKLANADSKEGWGTIKGVVTYDDKSKLPDNPAVNITADKAFCTKDGKLTLHRDEWVVDPKTRAVKNVIVWLSDADPAKAQKTAWNKDLIHPSLKEVPKKHEVDQPGCSFMPRVIALREGSELIVKNSAKVPHNIRIDGGDLGPKVNTSIPAGKELSIGEIKARFMPTQYDCTIHPWMKGWLISFEHPYYAVTEEDGKFELKNVPAGKFRLQVWHEGHGYVQKNKNDRGIEIEVKANETLDLNKDAATAKRLQLIQDED